MTDIMETKNLPRLKLSEMYKCVDKNESSMATVLKEAVAIPSLSQNEKYFPDITRMLKFCQSKMNDLGAKTELIESKNVKSEEDTIYPPVLFGNLFIDEGLKTVCVYGHVDIVSMSVGDEKKPGNFEMNVQNGKMHGLGVSRGKGPFLCWLNALKFYVAAKLEIPVNLKFIVEGIAELHSPTLDDIFSKKQDFFIDIDYTCLMVDKKINEIPCLRYGYRGVCHFSLDVNCGENDIEGGKYSGAFDQPLFDAVRVVSSLMDKRDKLDVPNISKDVVALSLLEKEIVEKFELDVRDMKKKIGTKRLRHNDIASRILIHKTRLPSITIHGFETSTDYSDDSNLAVIPCRTVAKFSIRLVNGQKSRDIRVNVEKHVKKVWNRCKSANDYELRMEMGIDPWHEDPTDPHYQAAAEAIKLIYGKDPLYVCDGYSLPAASILKSACPQASSLVLSLSDPNESSDKDESMSIENYLNGIKIIMAYMAHISEL